jgi:hypothetical protein
MLIPRFSLRWLLAVMTVCAGVSLVLSIAIRGEPWAIGAAAAIGSVIVLSGLHVLGFLGAWSVSQIEELVLSRRRAEQGVCPFATSAEIAAPVASGASEDPSPVSG